MLTYDYATNAVPGIRHYAYATYWRDVGTLEALAAAHFDVKGLWPRFDLRNRAWPIRGDLTNGER